MQRTEVELLNERKDNIVEQVAVGVGHLALAVDAKLDADRLG